MKPLLASVCSQANNVERHSPNEGTKVKLDEAGHKSGTIQTYMQLLLVSLAEFVV